MEVLSQGRSAVFREPTGPSGVVLEDRPRSEPEDGYVAVSVRASGLNHLDLWVASGALPQVSAEVLAHRIQCVVRVDASAELKACPVPVLYLQGSRDFVVPGWNAPHIKRLRPDV